MRFIKAIVIVVLILFTRTVQADPAVIRLDANGEVSPGSYGLVQFGNAPPPPVLNAQPVIIKRQSVVAGAPVYLHVPPTHAKKWARYCQRYNACNRQVYFVKSAEYKNKQ